MPQGGLDDLDGFFGARPAPQTRAAPPVPSADVFGGIVSSPPASSAAPVPAATPASGLDGFDFFSGGTAPTAPPKAPVVTSPPRAAPAAVARPAAVDEFDLFATGGASSQPQAPPPSAPPAAPVVSPPPSPAAVPDFDFFSGGAATAPPTPAPQAASFDNLDALGSIGGSAVKKAASTDPLDNIMGWGSASAAPQQAHVQTVVAPRAHGAEPDLFGTHISAAQVAVRIYSQSPKIRSLTSPPSSRSLCHTSSSATPKLSRIPPPPISTGCPAGHRCGPLGRRGERGGRRERAGGAQATPPEKD